MAARRGCWILAVALALTGLVAAWFTLGSRPPAADLPRWDARPGEPVDSAPIATLSVMSYNVEGLPPPARRGRAGYLHRIGGQLARMREAGTAPDVVLLQEAFSDPADPLETIAGYRFVAQGPVEADRSPPPDGAARAFVAAASAMRGEGAGKWIGSGLRILSDYPIVAVRRAAFPEWMCAGFDCLANKGVLIAWVAIPGRARPVAFIDTHLNSMRLAGVPSARSDLAFAWQVDAMRAFIARHVPPAEAAFFGGDFDTENRARRELLKMPPLAGARDALAEGRARSDLVKAEDARDMAAIHAHGVDRLYYRRSPDWPVELVGLSVPFGTRHDGTTLSDHMGFVARFRVGPAVSSGARR